MRHEALTNIGLLFTRIALGGLMIIHGAPKMIAGGPQGDWPGFKEQLALFEQNLNIPPLFGVLAIFAEFLGGIALVIGLLTRLASFGIACTMAVATYVHVSGGDDFDRIRYPAALCLFALGVMFSGAGNLSLDKLFFGKGRR